MVVCTVAVILYGSRNGSCGADSTIRGVCRVLVGRCIILPKFVIVSLALLVLLSFLDIPVAVFDSV